MLCLSMNIVESQKIKRFRQLNCIDCYLGTLTYNNINQKMCFVKSLVYKKAELESAFKPT